MAHYPLEFGWHTDGLPNFRDPAAFTAVMPTLLGGADPDVFPKADASADADPASTDASSPSEAGRSGGLSHNAEPPTGSPEGEATNDAARQVAPQTRWEDLSLGDRFAVAHQRRQHQDDAHGGVLAIISLGHRRARFNEIRLKQQNDEPLDYAEKRFLLSHRNVESELNAASERIASAQRGLRALPQSEKLRELRDAGSRLEAGKILWDHPGEIASAFAAEELPGLVLDLTARKVLGPAGHIVLAGVGGGRRFTSGVLEALEGEGVDITDGAALAKAASDSDLMARVTAKAESGAVAATASAIADGSDSKKNDKKPAAYARETPKKVEKTANTPPSESAKAPSLPGRTNYDVFETIFQHPAEGPRSGHRLQANRRFRDLLKEDKEFSDSINELFGRDVLQHMGKSKSRSRPLNPPSTEWHHNKPYDLRLLRKEEHRDKRLQHLLHPDGKGPE
jgi:hypothetical protein